MDNLNVGLGQDTFDNIMSNGMTELNYLDTLPENMKYYDYLVVEIDRNSHILVAASANTKRKKCLLSFGKEIRAWSWSF